MDKLRYMAMQPLHSFLTENSRKEFFLMADKY